MSEIEIIVLAVACGVSGALIGAAVTSQLAANEIAQLRLDARRLRETNAEGKDNDA